jgi:glucose/mannose-6-phosphate isomerase
MIETLESMSGKLDKAVPLEENQAKRIAAVLYGRFVFIYGAGITSEAACRWKAQLNENSKTWAACESFSELNHNTVAGYRFPASFAAGVIVLLLRSNMLPVPILKRYRVTCNLLEQFEVKYIIVDACGDNLLTQMMSLVLLGDYISYYLAVLNRVDPTPVKVIEYLKQELREE